MEQLKIILNPAARGGGARYRRVDIEQWLQKYNIPYDLVHTTHVGHGVALARQAVRDGYGTVAAAGGDGTVNEAINGLMAAKQAGEGTAVLGVLGIGRGNDFAYSMGIPTDLETAVRALAANQRRTIDVGWFVGGDFPHGRYFGNGVGIGFDAAVTLAALKMRRLGGFPGYIIAALRTVFNYYQAPVVEIQLEDKTFTRAALMVSIMNGRRLGGGFMLAPHGLANDGRLNLCIVNQVSRPRILTLIPHFMRGSQEGQSEVFMTTTTRVAVTAVSGDLPAHADGEIICTNGRSLTLEILPHQLDIITTPQEDTL